MASLLELCERIDAFLTEHARQQHAHHLGHAPMRLAKLFTEYPDLGDPEAFRRIDEALRAERTQEQFRPALRRIRAFLAQLQESAPDPSVHDALFALDLEGHVQLAHEALPLRDALSQLSSAASRERRILLEHATAQFLREHEGLFARAIELELDTPARLGTQDPVALRKELENLDEPALAQAASSVLRLTEDPYRDLLAYALKKIDPKLRPGAQAQWHDLLHLRTTPWLRAELGPGDVSTAAQTWLLALGFHPGAGQRIQRDLTPESNRSPDPGVFALRVPQEIALVLRPVGGLGDALDFLFALGRAQQAANTDADAPTDERRLGDAAVPQSFGLLFAHLLTEEGWLKRFLGLGRSDAREGARMAAFLQLVQLRSQCGALAFEAVLRERGPSRGVQDAFAEGMASALKVSVPGAFAYRTRALHPRPDRALRAFALEARVTRRLQERFDQDFFRNPAAGRALHGLFQPGQRDDADTLAQNFSGAPLDLMEAAARLVRVLNA